MATTADRLDGDVTVQVPATWGVYLGLLRARGDRSNPKYIYLKRRLTIVSPGVPHEQIKLRISWLIETMFVELGVNFLGSGSVTLKQGGVEKKGVEGDTSYYLTNFERVRDKSSLEMGVDPPPDLEVEVVVSNPVREALLVHAAFGVGEVWVCKASGLTFLSLGEDCRYRPVATSRCLPALSSDEFAPWVFGVGFPDEVSLRLAFRAWVAETLVPRVRDNPGGRTVKDRYCYAIVDENGGCWVLVDGGTEKLAGLPSLLREGWRPVRETSFVSGRRASLYILICLERVDDAA